MDRVIKILISFLLFTNFSFAKELAGVQIPDNLAKLQLNGAGIRSKFFFDLYVGALYLEETNANANQILNETKPMGMRLHIISSMITSEKMEEATREGFANSIDGDSQSLQPQIETFINVFRDKIEVGDIYDFIYTPQIGVDIYKNTTFKITIKGDEFKKALFGIWLGTKPAQESLKEAMLGK